MLALFGGNWNNGSNLGVSNWNLKSLVNINIAKRVVSNYDNSYSDNKAFCVCADS